MGSSLNSVRDACQRLGGIARSTFYTLVANREIAVVKMRRRTFVTEAELLRFIGSLEQRTGTANE